MKIINANVRGPAQQTFPAGIPAGHAQVGVGGEDRVVDGALQQDAMQPLGPLEFQVLGFQPSDSLCGLPLVHCHPFDC